MSTPQERLFEIYETYRVAFANRAADWKLARTMKEADTIERNVDALESAYLRAAKQALDANGPAVEAAYQAAKTARDDVTNAYLEARALADRIRSVGAAIKAVGGLLATASGN